MKASLEFRENQNPILKSKIPLRILTFPLRSSIEASNNPKELCFSLSTFWESGPLFKLNYRPNDPFRPFGLVLKTGVGSFGSPIGGPFTISVEYSFSGNNIINCNKNPSFFINFKPQIGDLAIRRKFVSEIPFPTQSSPALVPVLHGENVGVSNNKDDAGEKMTWTKLISGGFEVADGLVGKDEVCARTVAPVKGWATLKIRWGMRFPAVAREDGGWKAGKIPMPFLVLNKIGIERIARSEKDRYRDLRGNENGGGGDVAEACLDFKKEMDALRNENEKLKKDFEQFKSEIGGWKFEKNGTSEK